MRGLEDEAPDAEAAPEVVPDAEARLLHALLELSASAGRALDPGELVRLTADRACELLQGDAVALYLWDEAAGLLVPVYSNDPRAPDDPEPLRLGTGAIGQAMQRREIVVIPDYSTWDHAIPRWVERGVRAVEAVPLLVADRAIGALVVRFYSPRVISPDELPALTLLAGQAAPALEAARLYAASDREREHERALREITQALAANLDERRVLGMAVEFSARLLGAPYARVWLFEEHGGLSCAAAEGYVHSDTFTHRLAHDSISGQAARQRIVNREDAPHEAGWFFNREFGEQTGLGAYLGAGLWRAGEPLGVLEVMRAAGRRFTLSEEQLLVTLANAVAVAVSNARTHAEVEALAHEAERRAAEAASSELLLRTVYEAIGSGVMVFDASGAIVNANAAAAEITGRPVEQLLGMHSADFQVSVREDGSPLPDGERAVATALRTRLPVRKFVIGITRPDRQRRWLQLDAVPLLDPGGSVTQVVSSFIDITDRKQSEEALHQRDAILESVTFAAERLLRTHDWQDSIGAVLSQLGQATGASRVYIVPEAGADFRHARPHEWRAGGIAARDARPPGEPYLSALGLTRWEAILREGGIIQGQQHSFPDDERAVISAQGVCSLVMVPIFVGPTWWGFMGFDDCHEERDWSVGAVEVLRTAASTLGAAIERRRAESERLQLVREQSARAEAEAAQRRLAFLAEASRVLAASLDYQTTLQNVANLAVPTLADSCLVDMRDEDGSVRRVATAGLRQNHTAHQWSMEEAPSAVVEVLRTAQPRLYPELPPDLLRPLLGGIADEQEFTSGLVVPLVTRSETTGAITCLVSAGRAPFDTRDLSLTQDLARRCALAIESASLYGDAREAISIRDEFLSVAAHELKTPLTSLRGYAQLLGREFERGVPPAPDRARRAALTIQVQADKLARLVGQLLDISRIQSGKLAIEPRATDLSQVVREVLDSARQQFNGHTLVARLPEELPAHVDPLRIEQVVTNLIDNAIKYSPEGGQIDVVVEPDFERESVVLSVRDRGVGVPLEHRAHIFDRFYQAHAGGALTSMAGMGLGLYISRQIAELHGGSIDAEFPDDGGTRFLVSLPLNARSPGRLQPAT